MNNRALLAFGLLIAPATCFASDPTGLLFVFTIPILLVSVIAAFAIANASKTKLGYVGLVVLAMVNFLPGIFLTIELLRRERDFLPGIVHGAAYLLLLMPFKALHHRLNPPKEGVTDEGQPIAQADLHEKPRSSRSSSLGRKEHGVRRHDLE